MCILCIASRWSRHIAATVMPMVTLWALSQFLPQGFRFEITSPKLACVGVLFVSLSWCELVMPRLSAWRARRAGALKERRRVEALEALKRRKKATRRCRNCFTAYKDQTPGGSRFMCTYCGHVSKRPVLDLPAGASSVRSSFSLSGSAAEFLSGNGFFTVRSPKYWYDRASFVRPSWGSSRSWIGVGPWIDGANWGVSTSWFGGSWPGSALYFGNTGFGCPGSGALSSNGVFGGERWFAGESSYLGVFWFLLRVFSQLLVFAVWVWRKLSRAEYAEENETEDGDHDVCHTRDEDGGCSSETKGKKLRRKAEEKRLARLEKEHQEAEEKKQREEVARLVEERRRQRDRKLETEKENVRKAGVNLGKEEEGERREEKCRGKEKVPVKDNLKDQDIEELTERTNFVAPKSIKPTKNTGVKEKELNVKVASNFFSKWGAFKSRGSAKSGFFPQSKKASAPTKTSMSLSTDSNPSVKPFKAVVPSVSASSSASSSSTGTCTDVSGSVWTQTAWTNVLCHGVMEATDDTVKKSDMVERPSTNSSDGSRDLIHNLNESNIMGRISQEQCRTTSSYSDQWDYPFADSRCLPLAELPDTSFTEQGLTEAGSKVHHVAISTPLSLCINGLPPAMAIPSPQYSMSTTYIDSLEASTSAPFSNALTSLVLSKSASRPTYDSLCRVGPSSDYMTVNALGTESNPLVPLGITSLPSYNILQSTNADRRVPFQTWDPWNVSANNLNCQLSQDNWHHCSLTYPPQINTSHPPTFNSSFQQRDDVFEQTNVEPEFYLPSSLFSFEEIDRCECSCASLMPVKNNGLDSSGRESIMCAWEDTDVYHRVPPEFVDCITHSLMQDPVITADGHSYERSAIQDWLKLHDTSPKTGEVLPPPPGGNGVDKTLRPNHILRCQIIEFRERLTRRFGSHEGLKNSAPKRTATTARSDFFWPGEGSITTKPLSNSFYPTQVVDPVWSCDASGD